MKNKELFLGIFFFFLFLDLYFLLTNGSSVIVICIHLILLFLCLMLMIGYRREKREYRILLSILEAAGTGEYHRSFLTSRSSGLKELGQEVNRLLNQLKIAQQNEGHVRDSLDAILSHMPIGLVLFDVHQDIKQTSNSLVHFLPEHNNYSLKNLKDFHQHDMRAFIYTSYSSKQVIEKEFDNDRGLVFQATAIPILNDNHQIKEVLVLFYDVSQIRHFERIRSDFVTNASHELRTPVTAIRGFAETLLEMDDEDVVNRRAFLSIIQKESLRLEHIINDILVLARSEVDRELLLSEIPLRSLIDDVVKVLEKQAMAKDITVHVLGEENLIFETDRELLMQVLLNLLSNAIRYSLEGGEIWLSFEASEKSIIIKVKDQGIGIAKEKQDLIFDRFYRVNKGRSRKSGGSGLGLSIVKDLVNRMGGNITVESELDKGSTFSLVLPYIKKGL